MQNLPVPTNRQLQPRNSEREKEIFGYAMSYIMAILAGKISVEAACNVLHARFPTTGFDKAKAEHVAWRKARDRRRAEKTVIITEL
jgi:hypothetical protein